MVKTTSATAKNKTSGRVAAKAAKTTAVKTKSKKPNIKHHKSTGSLGMQLRNIQLISAAVFFGLAAAAIWLMQTVAYPLYLGYMTKDELGGGFASAWQPVLDVEIRWLLVTLLLLSAILPFLYFTRLKTRYDSALSTGMITWRWIDAGVTFGLVIFIVALLSGVSDVMTLFVISSLVVIASLLSLIAENQRARKEQSVQQTLMLSVVSAALPWLLILLYAISTIVYGLVRAPWYLYALYAAGLVGFVLWYLNQWQHLRGNKNWKNYLFTERNYLVINLILKVSVAVILLSGLQK